MPSTVTNLMDSGPGSLRQAILDTPAGGTVDFQPDLTGTITLSTGALDIAKDLTIDGPGASTITVSGNHTSRVFYIESADTVAIAGLTIADGSDPIRGGGVMNFGQLTITDSVISRCSTNDTASDGGGIANDGTLTVVHSTVSSNFGAGGAGVGGAGGISNRGTVTILGCIISGNSAGGFRTSFGGGIGNFPRGTMTITDSTISDNFMIAGGLGAGIFNDEKAQLTVTNCALSGNSTPYRGGGITNDGTATVTNCTFTGNSAADGGAINNLGALTVVDSTLGGNSATRDGGGIWNLNAVYSVVHVRNTIVAGNSGGSSADVSGVVVSLGYNLIRDGTGGSGYADTDLVGTPDNPIDPMLGPLQDNGGPTWTQALLPGSLALNNGDPSELGNLDQRGVVRTGGANIGAYQASASAFVLTAPDTVTSGLPFDISVTAVDIFGQTAVGYSGIVTFSTSDADPGVVLPADYTFTAADGGSHTFTNTGLGEITLITPGDQTMTVTDTADNTITGSVMVTVDPASVYLGRAFHKEASHGSIVDAVLAEGDQTRLWQRGDLAEPEPLPIELRVFGKPMAPQHCLQPE
jgi:hypothetical protein